VAQTGAAETAAAPIAAETESGPTTRFQCNVCGAQCTFSIALTRLREEPSCTQCGSNLRFRTLIHGLSVALFGRAVVLSEFPLRADLRGIGLSDADLYAQPLGQRLSYTNTYFHTAPLLDIANIGTTEFSGLDFIIASDVFEHVAPPIDVAFRNARQLLRDGGVLVFSVPYVPGIKTQEHFPDLHDYVIEKDGEAFVLLNRTREGELQRFEELVFHGGPGTTLEMRLFSYEDLQRHFLAAGFESPILLDEYLPQFGIDWRGEYCSIPMIARACAVPDAGVS
jgi:SAM-dependent methyltransferase